jgi:hypothetical protein
MSSGIQLISLSISFLYGIIFYYLSIINFKVINNLKNIIKNIITIIYVFDISIIYVILVYKINNGYFHIYFILMVILGYILGNYLSKIYVKVKANKLQ